MLYQASAKQQTQARLAITLSEWRTQSAETSRSVPYTALSKAVFALAHRDARFSTSTGANTRLPEDEEASARFQLESARVWLTKHGDGMEMWCYHMQYPAEDVVEATRKLLSDTLEAEKRVRESRFAGHPGYRHTLRSRLNRGEDIRDEDYDYYAPDVDVRSIAYLSADSS